MDRNAIWAVNEETTRIRIKVKPKSGKFKIEKEGSGITIHVKAPPLKGKANNEIIKGLAKVVKVSSSKIRMVSGLTSTEKVIEIDAPIKEVLEKLN